MKRIQLSEENKQDMIKKIKNYFANERDEDLGDLAADLVLDFVTDELGNHFYNQGIEDSIAYMSDKVDDLYGLKL